MRPHDRFIAVMHFEAVDRPPLWESGLWASALRRWQREALGEGVYPPQYAECENKVQCSVDLWMVPRYEEQVLAEDEQYVTRRSDRGQIMREPKSPDTMSMPEHLEYPVKSRADWEALKRRFDPGQADRFPADWADRCARWRVDGPVLVFQGPRSPSLFGFVRELMGPERTLYAFYDEPDLVHDMMEYNTEFILGLLPRVLDEAPLTSIYFWEDMCYKGGPLISPAMFREFMLEPYKKITGALHDHGVHLIFVDSDGDSGPLIPYTTWSSSALSRIWNSTRSRVGPPSIRSTPSVAESRATQPLTRTALEVRSRTGSSWTVPISRSCNVAAADITLVSRRRSPVRRIFSSSARSVALKGLLITGTGCPSSRRTSASVSPLPVMSRARFASRCRRARSHSNRSSPECLPGSWTSLSTASK